MKSIFASIITCLLVFPVLVSSQTPVLYEENFTEYTTDAIRFSIYVDTARTYVYQDIEKTREALEACQLLLDDGVDISDSIRFEFISTNIYHQYVKIEPLEAYKVIANNESFIEESDVSSYQRSRFNYLKSFTYMSLGDHEAAQKAYYIGVETGKMEKVTQSVVDNLYSLGQLFYDQEDYEQSISYYKEVLAYTDMYDIPYVTLALTYLEMAVSLSKLEEFSDSKIALRRSESYAKEYDLDFMRPNILMEKGQVHFLMNEIDSLEFVLEQLKTLDKGNQDQNYTINLYNLQSKVHKANGEYKSALLIYDKMLALTDSTHLEDQVSVHAKAYDVYEKLGEYKLAFEHLQSSKELEDKIAHDEKMQKTEYLKIRYNLEQKEKDNALLKATLFEQKAQQNLLFGGLAFASLLLLGFIAAFKQKARYSLRLEETVASRTKRLKKSNSLLNESNIELEEMNRILSHDLKEPIRSIVSFSELIEREQTLLPKSKKYLGYVKDSGKQLDKLIKDVNLLRDTDSLISRVTTYNANELLQQVVDDLQESSPRKIFLQCPPIPSIKGTKDVMKHIFSGIIQNSINFNKNEAIKIEVSYVEEDEMHTFHLKDNGIGIEKKYQTQIFDLFKRLNNRGEFSGSGLGLSIVKRFVESLEGTISVYDSIIGEGTTIEVKCPKL